MNREIALNFRNQLRDARALAFQDAEAFDQVIFAIERLGLFLTGTLGTLGNYENALHDSAGASPLARTIPDTLPTWHASFDTLYCLIRMARNDALHQGAFARHLTVHAVELAVILEDALMIDVAYARDFMVQNPVCARIWEPVSSIRRTMLVNAFSYLPVEFERDGRIAWHLVSDFTVASYLRAAPSANNRRERLAAQLGKVVASGDIDLVLAATCSALENVASVLASSKGLPVLVLGPDPTRELLGLITPFDLL